MQEEPFFRFHLFFVFFCSKNGKWTKKGASAFAGRLFFERKTKKIQKAIGCQGIFCDLISCQGWLTSCVTSSQK